MAVWTTKITHHVLTLSPFTAEQMSDIGSVVANGIRDRIQSATSAEDQPAKPLVEKYAKRKISRGSGIGRFPVRNWTFRDVTLKSIKVKSASEDHATIGFVDQRAVNIVNGIAKYDQMWGMAPSDLERFYHAIAESMKKFRSVKFVRTGQKVA